MLSQQRDAARAEALALLQVRHEFDFSTVHQSGSAPAWMDMARLDIGLGHEDEALDALARAVDAGWSDPSVFAESGTLGRSALIPPSRIQHAFDAACSSLT